MNQSKLLLSCLFLLLASSLAAQVFFDRRYGVNTENFEQSTSAVLAPDDGMLIYGVLEENYALRFFMQRLDSSGVELWRKTYPHLATGLPSAVISAAGGGYLATGAVLNPDDGSYDAVLLHIDEGGDLLWHKTFGDEATNIGMALCQLADGTVVVMGSTVVSDNTAAFFQAAFTVAGAMTHYVESPAANEVTEVRMTATADGGYAAVLRSGFSFFSPTSAAAIKYDAMHEVQWSGSISGMSIYTGSTIANLYDLKATDTGVLFCLGTQAGALHLIHRANSNAAVLWSRRQHSGNVSSAAVHSYDDGTIGVAAHSFPFFYKRLSATDGSTLDSAGVPFLQSLIIGQDALYVFGAGRSLYLFGNISTSTGEQYIVNRIDVSGVPAVLWRESFGVSTTNEDETGHDIASTPDGGFVLAGVRKDTLGEDAVWVLKADPHGTVLWERVITIGADIFSDAEIGSVNVDAAGNIAVFAASDRFEAEFHLLKLSPGGNLLFDKLILATNYSSDFFRAYPLPDAGYIACIDPDNPEMPMLIRLDQNGNMVWQKQYNGSLLGDVLALPNGHFVGAGGKGGQPWLFEVDEAGNLVWEKTYVVAPFAMLVSLAHSSDGFLLATGVAGNAAGTQYDALALKANPAGGAPEWHKTFSQGANSYWIGYTILPTSGGGMCMTGFSLAPPANPDFITSSFFRQRISVSWLDADGNALSHQLFGNDATRPFGQNADLTPGGVVFCGTTDLSSSMQDAWVVKVAPVTVASREPQAAGNLQLTPNPASSTALLSLSSPYRGAVQAQIFDARGQAVATFHADKPAEIWTAPLALESYPAGIYQVVVSTSEGRISRKLVVHR